MVPEASRYSAFACLEAGFAHLPNALPTVKLLNMVWTHTRSTLHIEGFFLHTPLWRNARYREVLKLEGFGLWERSGLQYVSQLYQSGVLRTFLDLQQEFGLPRGQFFRFLQLRHALEAQSRVVKMGLTKHAILDEVFNTRDKRGMISRAYNILLNSVLDASTVPARRGWERDLGALDGETWDLCLSSARMVSVSASQRVSHLMLLHRAYRTPLQLFHWGRRDSPLCPKCNRDQGTLLHMMWKCPKLFRYWTDVIGTISSTFGIRLPRDPVICLLGALDEDSVTPSTQTAVIRALYAARKLIAQYWITSRVPTAKQWVSRINALLVWERLTYVHRKVPNKFYSMWQPWLDNPSIAPHQLVRDRLVTR